MCQNSADVDSFYGVKYQDLRYSDGERKVKCEKMSDLGQQKSLTVKEDI